MLRAAEWVAGQLRYLGMSRVQVMPTAGHPVVFGELLQAGKDKPVVLVYGHYDVQPAEPLELWHTPPFEPTQSGENLFGRGASDMKGQVVACLKAIESLSNSGNLPVNVKFFIEGEEEIGSPNLAAFIIENKELLASDFALNPDAGDAHPGLTHHHIWAAGTGFFRSACERSGAGFAFRAFRRCCTQPCTGAVRADSWHARPARSSYSAGFLPSCSLPSIQKSVPN